MINSEYTIKLENGKEILKRFVAGSIVRINPEEGNRPLSFDLAINKGKGKPPEYINRIAVDKKTPFHNLIKNLKPGQQIFCELTITMNGQYKNYWLYAFELGRSPQKN